MCADHLAHNELQCGQPNSKIYAGVNLFIERRCWYTLDVCKQNTRPRKTFMSVYLQCIVLVVARASHSLDIYGSESESWCLACFKRPLTPKALHISPAHSLFVIACYISHDPLSLSRYASIHLHSHTTSFYNNIGSAPSTPPSQATCYRSVFTDSCRSIAKLRWLRHLSSSVCLSAFTNSRRKKTGSSINTLRSFAFFSRTLFN